jgi:hypothetical protein
VTGTGDRQGIESAPARIATLPLAERRVLAALAIVGRASLSVDELTELAEMENVTPLVADLERRGLVRRDEKRRYSALGRIGEEIRQTNDALSTGERLLQYMRTLAEGGQLTPERLLDDAEAILGLTEWAAESQRWERLLELVKTLQGCFEIESRVEEWLTLLDRGRRAAHALGDQQSEVWALEQLAAASASAGNHSAARRYSREAKELQRGPRLNLQRVALWALGLIAFAAAGGATGYAIGHSNGDSDRTTRQIPVTVTVGGQTVTTSTMVTTPATTVISTTTVVSPPPPSSATP